jgi:putative flippase GtrA
MVTTLANAAGRFGVNPREAERFIKFLFVGAFGFLVDFGVFNLTLGPLKWALAPGTGLHEWLFSLGLDHEYVAVSLAALIAGTVSFIAAIISNFIWNRYWTYPDSRSKKIWGQFVQFILVSVTGIFFRIPIIAISRTPFTRLTANVLPNLDPDLSIRLGENLALALSVLLVLFWNFFVNRYWTYNDVE